MAHNHHDTGAVGSRIYAGVLGYADKAGVVAVKVLDILGQHLHVIEVNAALG